MSPDTTEEPSPTLTGLITSLGAPLMTARDQPPAPGSHWIDRGWHNLRRVGGRGLDVLPKKTSTGMVVARLIAVVLIWLLIAAVAVEVLAFWVVLVLPFQLLARRRARADQPTPPAMLPPSPPGWTGSYPPPLSPAPTVNRLATAPDPDPEPATDTCPMCGGVTAKAHDTCRFCGSPLPMVARRGWHPDPLGGTGRRWYDGASWTEHTRLPA